MTSRQDVADRPPLLSITGLRKEFPGLVALDDVSLDVHSGEIVAVLGHNGSGKSTLVKILAGVYTADGGGVTVGRAGGEAEMHFIHQDLGLIPELTAVENLEMVRGAGTRALSPHRRAADVRRTRERLAPFGAAFDIEVPISNLSAAQRSIIAIARALDGWQHDENVLVLDEPTEALHKSEVDILFSAVRGIAARGAGVIFISHRLDEVMNLAHRIVVLKDGVKVADVDRRDMDHDQLVRLITGVSVPEERRVQRASDGEPALQVTGLTGKVVRGIDLEVRPGEVVGVAGVLGSGREEIPALMFGARPGSVQHMTLAGRPRPLTDPAASIASGMAYVPGDRARFGAVLPFSARENVTLPRLGPLRRWFGRLDARAERAEAGELMTRFGVVPGNAEQRLANFSGGNQQKVVLSKWLRNRPTILLLEEPTQGVDVGAKATIYTAIMEAAAAGTAVLVCSSDSKELVQLCSRVLVLRDGRVARELTGDEVNEELLLREGYGVGLAPASSAHIPQETHHV